MPFIIRQLYLKKAVKIWTNMAYKKTSTFLSPFLQCPFAVYTQKRNSRGLWGRPCLCSVLLLCCGSEINYILFWEKRKWGLCLEFRVGSLCSNHDLASYKLNDSGQVMLSWCSVYSAVRRMSTPVRSDMLRTELCPWPSILQLLSQQWFRD